MYRLILIAVLAASIPVAAHAQSIRGFGVKAGVASANISFEDGMFDSGERPETSLTSEQVRRYGAVVSGFVEWFDHPNVSILTELAFIEKGYAVESQARDDQNNPGGTYTFATQLNYLSASVPLKVRVSSIPGSPYIALGPRLDVLVGGNPDGPNSLAESYRTTAFGWNASAGIDIERPGGADFIAEVVYGRDQTNSLPENDLSRTAYNNAAAFMVGLRW